MPMLSVPQHTPGCTYPMLLRVRLLPRADEAPPAATAMETEGADGGAAEGEGEGGGGGGGGGAPARGGGAMAPAERVLFEEYTSMVAQAFFESHRDGAKQLVAMQEAFARPRAEREGPPPSAGRPPSSRSCAQRTRWR